MNGKRMRERRKELKMTQEALANSLGVKRAVISKYETGMIEPSMRMCIDIAENLQIPFAQIAFSDDEQIMLSNAIQPHMQKVVDKMKALGFNKDDTVDKILGDLVSSFGDSWGVLESWAFLKDLSNTTDEEKLLLWELIKTFDSYGATNE